MHLNILPECNAIILAPIKDCRHFAVMIYLLFIQSLTRIAYITATYTKRCPSVKQIMLAVKRLKQHSIRMLRQHNVCPPVNCTPLFSQHIKDSHICHMPLACCSQTSIQSNLKGCCIIVFSFKFLRCRPWPHCMAARWSFTYFIYLLYTLHNH